MTRLICCIFCSADTRTKLLGFALQNSALKWAGNDSHAFTVLNDDAEYSGHTVGGKVKSASIKFSNRSSQNCSTRLSFGRWDVKSNAKRSLTSVGGKCDSSNIIFKNWLISESFFPYCLLSSKDCIFRHQLGPKWKRHTLTSNPGHTVITALWMAVSKSA